MREDADYALPPQTGAALHGDWSRSRIHAAERVLHQPLASLSVEWGAYWIHTVSLSCGSKASCVIADKIILRLS